MSPDIRDCSTCIGPTLARPICNACDESYSAWEAKPIAPGCDAIVVPMRILSPDASLERLMDLAHGMATAKAMAESLRALGKPHAEYEAGYQAEARHFRAAMRAAVCSPLQERTP